MRKDLKIGLIIGVVLVAGATLVVSIWPGASVEDRVIHASSKKDGDDENSKKTTLPTKETSERDREERVNELLEQAEKATGKEQDEEGPVTIDIPQERVHTVTAGETLSHISEKYYGTSRQWQKILDANRNVLKKPEDLRPGMKLVIPR